ncbi:MAG: hypothetical protein AAF098_05980 [Pseudomonadota bacterium]
MRYSGGQIDTACVSVVHLMSLQTATGAETPISSVSSLEDLAYGRARRKVFLVSFLAALAVGLAYTLLQPKLYQSSSTVLMTAPTEIDAELVDVDVQGVAIQRRVLTGSEITRSLAELLEQDYALALTPLELRSLLTVQPVPETNLLELHATGDEPDILPPVVESWIDVYTGVRARDIEQRRSRTLVEVQTELTSLANKLSEARLALDEFRNENEIVSMERQENAVLAELDGLNQALNNAIETEVNAEAYLNTLQASLDAGEQFVPEQERSGVAAMTKQLAILRTRLGELRARYTDDYIAKDPRLREIPDQIAELTESLKDAYAEGTSAELANAERDFRSARESARQLRVRLDAHKVDVANFNTIYATHEALVEDLARLEELHREAQARLVQIEVSQVDRYPQLSVIDWPSANAVRIGPSYAILLAATGLGALLTAVFAVWLHGYLNPRSQQPAFVTLSGVHMYPNDTPALVGAAADKLENTGTVQLEHQAQDHDAGQSPSPGASAEHGDEEDITEDHNSKP